MLYCAGFSRLIRRQQEGTDLAGRISCGTLGVSMRLTICGFWAALIMSAAFLVQPAAADHEESQVPGLGEVIYHEGNVEAFGDGINGLQIAQLAQRERNIHKVKLSHILDNDIRSYERYVQH